MMITIPTARLKAGFVPAKKNDKSAKYVITPSATIRAPKTTAMIPPYQLAYFHGNGQVDMYL